MDFRTGLSAHPKTIVVKLGSAAVVGEKGLRLDTLKKICHDLAQLQKRGHHVVLISSGAISMAKTQLSSPILHPSIEQSQALSAIGQPLLMKEYTRLFQQQGLGVAQVLLTHEDIKIRKRFFNLKKTIKTLLEMGIIPILNENDSVSFAEITLGDNDQLAASVAQMVDAQVLLMLTSTPGLFTENPSLRSARHLPVIEKRSDLNLVKYGQKSSVGKGGMQTKVEAAFKVWPMGIITIIDEFKGSSPVIGPLTKERGTIFLPTQAQKLRPKLGWLHTSVKKGAEIQIDEGATNALFKKKSLLASGVLKVKGDFNRGDCVMIKSGKKILAHGISRYSADDLAKIKGLNQSKIKSTLGVDWDSTVIHRNDLALKE